MDCVNCGAPLPAKTTRCHFCQSLNDVDLRGHVTVEKRSTTRDCPRCRETMTAVVLQIGAQPLELDRCDTCFGLFFDPGEIETVLDGIEYRAHTVDHRQLVTLIEEETPVETLDQVRYVPCPDCLQLMNRRQFGQRSGVVIDHCKEHGLWLDGGELRRLIRWTQAGGRRHDAEQKAEKQRLDARVQAMPATVESRDPGSGRPTLDRPTHRRGVGDLFSGDIDLLDIVDVLGGLARLIR
ncbi:MAG: zf-TFIIB domain-containing protein [Acidobacteriota bacterium]